MQSSPRTRAMERSSERNSNELIRTASDLNRRPKGNTPSAKPQKIRFSPPSALHRQRSRLHPTAPASVCSTLHDLNENTYVERYQESPSIHRDGENYGAEPSSYRKIRKAKSLLTPRQWAISPHVNTSYSPVSVSKSLRTVNSSLGFQENGLKVGLKRSMSFLRPSGRVNRTGGENELYSEQTIQMAREQFVLEQRAISRKPSLMFHPKARRQQKTFRKSMRKNTSVIIGEGVKSENQIGLEVKPESKFRSLSLTVRDKVMRVFGKTLNKESFPPQQLEASRQHFHEYMDGSGTENKGFESYHIDESQYQSRGSLYIPSQPEGDFLEDLDKISATLRSSASCESLHSAARSRVTSWTNSTIAGSVVNRSNTALEPKRLSVIKEDGGPHQPSSSAGRHIGGLSSVSPSLSVQDNHSNQIPHIDSQRIYSALMKRIDQEQQEMELAEKELELIHQQKQPNEIQKSGREGSKTIRPVRSETSMTKSAPDPEYREFSVGSDAPTWESISQERISMTPQQHRENVEKRRERMRTTDCHSSFYPFSSEIGPTSPSPFKLALKARRGDVSSNEESADGEEQTDTNLGADSESVLHHPRVKSKLGQGRFGMSDESIYSRTTGGGTNGTYVTPVGSSEDVASGLGMATIVPNRLIRYPRPTERMGQLQRQRSNPWNAGVKAEDGDKDWKGWLEKEMTMQNLGHKISLTLHRSGSKASRVSQKSHHVREHAQIVAGEDVELGSEQTFGGKSRSAHQFDVKFSPETYEKMGENNSRFPLLELKEVSRSNTPVPKRSGSDGLSKSQSGVLSTRKSVNGLSFNDENKKMGGRDGGTLSLKKLSPGYVAGMLKKGKNRTIQGDSPPLSTPGKLNMLQEGNGRIRPFESNRGSDRAGDDILSEVTPTSARRRHPKYQFSFGDGQGSSSPSERGGTEKGFKQHGYGLSARLSRPFDMAIPGANRPFDSMFLGKGSGLLSGDLGLPRLSVAPGKNDATIIASLTPEIAKGLPPTTPEMTTATSGTPKTGVTGSSTSTGTRGVKGIALGLSSKRMVSNFLRSRRKNTTTSSTNAPSNDGGDGTNVDDRLFASTGGSTDPYVSADSPAAFV